MPDIEDFGLKSRHKCQVECPVLKAIYNSIQKKAEDTMRQVRPDDTERNKAYFRGYEEALRSVVIELGLAISPKAMAGLLSSMCESE